MEGKSIFFAVPETV